MNMTNMSDSQRRAMFAKMNRNQFQFYGVGQRIASGLMTPGGVLEPEYLTDPLGSAVDVGTELAGSVRRGVETPGGALGAFSWTDPRAWADYGTDYFKRAGRTSRTFGRSMFQGPTGMVEGLGDVISAGREPARYAMEYPSIITRGVGAASGALPRGFVEGLTYGQPGPYRTDTIVQGGLPGMGTAAAPTPEDAQKAAGLLDYMKRNPGTTALALGLGGIGLGMAMSD